MFLAEEILPFPFGQNMMSGSYMLTAIFSLYLQKKLDTSSPQSLMGETNASRLRRSTPTLREAAPRLRVAPLDGS